MTAPMTIREWHDWVYPNRFTDDDKVAETRMVVCMTDEIFDAEKSDGKTVSNRALYFVTTDCNKVLVCRGCLQPIRAKKKVGNFGGFVCVCENQHCKWQACWREARRHKATIDKEMLEIESVARKMVIEAFAAMKQ